MAQLPVKSARRAVSGTRLARKRQEIGRIEGRVNWGRDESGFCYEKGWVDRRGDERNEGVVSAAPEGDAAQFEQAMDERPAKMRERMLQDNTLRSAAADTRMPHALQHVRLVEVSRPMITCSDRWAEAWPQFTQSLCQQAHRRRNIGRAPPGNAPCPDRSNPNLLPAECHPKRPQPSQGTRRRSLTAHAPRSGTPQAPLLDIHTKP